MNRELKENAQDQVLMVLDAHCHTKPERDIVYELVVCIYPAESRVFISSLWVAPNLRGKHLASALLLEAMQVATRHKASEVSLDDMSDAYGKSSGNIYINSGLKYVGLKHGSEMRGYVSTCRNKLTRILLTEPLQLDISIFQKHRSRYSITKSNTRRFVYTHRGYC